MFGELIPVGGGDPIPLLKKSLLVGRRESCDIVLRFPNVSAHHCQLTLMSGYWYIRDLQSRNGVKVNNLRVTEKRLDPGDSLAIAKHRYEVQYSPADLGAIGPPPPETGAAMAEVFSKSLLERAGLTKDSTAIDRSAPKRYDVHSNRPGQIKDPFKPL
ncbi:MAG TPA: FHA domain-containing protein [Pirellulales bacterium]|jgi:adenylate cyclase|nr:FHA domain-containing protein [Pirellulales bacterium]